MIASGFHEPFVYFKVDARKTPDAYIWISIFVIIVIDLPCLDFVPHAYATGVK